MTIKNSMHLCLRKHCHWNYLLHVVIYNVILCFRICAIESKCNLGSAKGCGYKSDSPPNHVWNVVRIQDCWHHMDCSWGAGYLGNHTEEFVSDYTDHYLCYDPLDFIRDHFPLESRWQLLKTPISLQYFEVQGCTTK